MSGESVACRAQVTAQRATTAARAAGGRSDVNWILDRGDGPLRRGENPAPALVAGSRSGNASDVGGTISVPRRARSARRRCPKDPVTMWLASLRFQSEKPARQPEAVAGSRTGGIEP